MKYFDELQEAMRSLGQKPDTIFIGQTVGCPGTFMFPTLKHVDMAKRIELPVNEQLQMQMTLGLALAGYVPVSVYPRQNFMLYGVGDLVNMLDKISIISNKEIEPKFIIRVASGPFKPVHPGHQHIGNYAKGLREMLTMIDVLELEEPCDIGPAYKYAYERRDCKSTIIIEEGNYYNEK